MPFEILALPVLVFFLIGLIKGLKEKDSDVL